jgi:aldose 1-epimerase
MPMPELVSISNGDSMCTLCPTIGGSIASWSVGGQDMLRRANADGMTSGDPLAMASFPLVPFSNRIGYGRFIWEKREIALSPNFPPEPHAIHGTGWTRSWTVAEIDESHCLLTMHHDADARWPWSFDATQQFSLTGDQLQMSLSAANLSDEPAPLAFGHHPYFESDRAHLTFTAAQVLVSGDDALPTKSVTPTGQYDFGKGGPVAGREIDHCYAGWDGKARIEWTDRPLALNIETCMTAAVVYVPKGGGDFCFEPVPHLTNALNRPGDLPAMPKVQPGQSFTSSIRLMAVRA